MALLGAMQIRYYLLCSVENLGGNGYLHLFNARAVCNDFHARSLDTLHAGGLAGTAHFLVVGL